MYFTYLSIYHVQLKLDKFFLLVFMRTVPSNIGYIFHLVEAGFAIPLQMDHRIEIEKFGLYVNQ